MAGMPWVKLYTEILDDMKMNRLTDAQKWRFIQLILLAAECDAEGTLVTGDTFVTHEDVTNRLRCDSQELKKDMSKLKSLGLVTIDDGVITIVSFTNRQGPTQEEKRKKWRERQRKRRERAKMSPESHGGVTPLEEEEEEDSNVSNDTPPRKPRQETKRNKNRKILQDYFIEKTGLPSPKYKTQTQVKAAQRLWWSPIDEFFELADEDAESGKRLIDTALVKLDGVTISDPNSILKTVRSVYAEAKRHGKTKQKFVEWS